METVNLLLTLPLVGVVAWIGFRVLRFVVAVVIVALSGIASGH